MAVLDTIYRIFMFVLPYALCFAAYWWVGKKARRVQQPMARVLALVVIGGGVAYTVYRLVTTVKRAVDNDLFEFVILIVAVAVLALASIIMAIAEPEEQEKTERRVVKNEGNGGNN